MTRLSTGIVKANSEMRNFRKQQRHIATGTIFQATFVNSPSVASVRFPWHIVSYLENGPKWS